VAENDNEIKKYFLKLKSALNKRLNLMNIIVLQGINGHVGTSSVSAALAYSLNKINIKTIVLDGAFENRGATVCSLFANDDTQTSYGWYDAVHNHKSLSNQKNKSNVVFSYEGGVLFAPKGKSFELLGLKEADELASDLVTTLNNTQGIEFAIIDAGQRNSSFARAIAAKAHMAITILEAEGNSLNRLNEIEIEDNEYLLLNKVTRKSKIMTDIVLLLRESKIKNSLLNSDISYDESVMNSFLYDMPYPRYFSVSSASLDTEKVMFEIILICNAVNGNTTL
jgi:cellulose biosynthesis protein BcsQ